LVDNLISKYHDGHLWNEMLSLVTRIYLPMDRDIIERKLIGFHAFIYLHR
jgi:hypothetical protein